MSGTQHLKHMKKISSPGLGEKLPITREEIRFQFPREVRNSFPVCKGILGGVRPGHPGRSGPQGILGRRKGGSSVQSIIHVWLFGTPWTACQASLCIINSQSLLRLMSIELVMPSNHLLGFEIAQLEFHHLHKLCSYLQITGLYETFKNLLLE